MEVEPIRNMKDVKRFYDYLNEHYTPREAECFLIGCNLALRAGDLLKLRFDQMGGEFLELREQKTNKYKKIPLTPVIYDAVDRLRYYYDNTKFYTTKELYAEYLFQSTCHRSYHVSKPICIQHLSKVFKTTSSALNLNYNVNTHTMRKTWGYHAYENGQDIAYIQALFNHAHQRVTLNYIGVTRSAIQNMYRENAIDLAS